MTPAPKNAPVEPEEWRSIPSAPGYQASSHGHVRNDRTLRVLRCGNDRKGYRTLSLSKKYRRVCTLVCEAFHGARPPDHQCRHLDGRNQHDTPDNLKWGTAKENHDDMVLHGTRRANTRLTTMEVAAIRDEYRLGDGPRLGIKYGVNESTILKIAKRQRWSTLA